MQLEFEFRPASVVASSIPAIPLLFVRHRRARRYILRLLPDGTARVTLPRWGTLAEATRFAKANTRWLEAQFLKQVSRPRPDTRWRAGTVFHFRGEPVRLEVLEGTLSFGDQSFRIEGLADGADLKMPVQRQLWKLAVRELPARVNELAAAHGFAAQIRRVCVRNQRSRWGSCSRRGTLSLNWRLLQAPDFVRDYIILHELAHLRHMNHSRRFWAEVERLCPDYADAERWLKQHSQLLR